MSDSPNNLWLQYFVEACAGDHLILLGCYAESAYLLESTVVPTWFGSEKGQIHNFGSILVRNADPKGTLAYYVVTGHNEYTNELSPYGAVIDTDEENTDVWEMVEWYNREQAESGFLAIFGPMLQESRDFHGYDTSGEYY